MTLVGSLLNQGDVLTQGTLANVDPSQTDAIVAALAGTGVPASAQGTEFYLDEIDAGHGGLFAGWSLPSTDSGHEFFQLISYAEQFAAASGWRYFPTPFQLQWGVEHGVAQMDESSIFGWMAGMAGIGTTEPWAAAGMTQTAYDDKVASYSDIAEQLTGSRDAFSSMHSTFLGQRWSPQRIQAWARQDPGLLGTYGYLKYGYDYQGWQQFKQQQKTTATQRFGANALTDPNYLQLLSDPLTQFQASGSAVQAPSPQSPLTQTYASAIR